MALAVTTQVFSGTTFHGCVYGHAKQSVEKRLECGILRGASASPEFGGTDGGEKDQRVGLAECEPLRHNGFVAASRYLDQDVRIGEDGHRSSRRPSLEPRRNSLTSSLLSAALARDFRIPTKLCIAAIRASWRPRYRSRAACRTNSEIVVFSLRARAWSATQSWSSRNSCVRLTMYIIHRHLRANVARPHTSPEADLWGVIPRTPLAANLLIADDRPERHIRLDGVMRPSALAGSYGQSNVYSK